MKNLDGKRNIRWNQSVEACGNGISGKGPNGRAALGRAVYLFVDIINGIFCIKSISQVMHGAEKL